MPSKSSLQRQIFSSGNLNHAGMIGSDTKRGHSRPTVVRYDQPGPLSLVEECRGLALIGREPHSVEIFS